MLRRVPDTGALNKNLCLSHLAFLKETEPEPTLKGQGLRGKQDPRA